MKEEKTMIKIKRTGKTLPVYDLHVTNNHNFLANGVVVHNCTEILEPTNANETAVCNLSSLNLAYYVKDGKLDKAKIKKNVQIAVKFLDKVIDRNFYPIPEAETSNKKLRPVGLGIMGFQDMLYQMKLPYESEEAVALSSELMEEIYYWALKTSCELAKELGPYEDFKESQTAKGILHFDHFNVTPKNTKRFDELREEIKRYGLRNSLLLAIAPTSSIASIVGSEDCIEPTKEHLYQKSTLSGDFIVINKWLVNDLKERGLWTKEMSVKLRNAMLSNKTGTISGLQELPDDVKSLYKTVWEIKQKSVLDHAIARTPFIDQSQSVNLFVSDPTIEKLSSMYMYAWQNKMKTTYYLRSKGATEIERVTTGTPTETTPVSKKEDEVCEACQ